jgi:hypothetical protein
MRVLTGEFIFQEVSKDVFKHSRHSIGLTGSLGARSFMAFMYVSRLHRCRRLFS